MRRSVFAALIITCFSLGQTVQAAPRFLCIRGCRAETLTERAGELRARLHRTEAAL